MEPVFFKVRAGPNLKIPIFPLIYFSAKQAVWSTAFQEYFFSFRSTLLFRAWSAVYEIHSYAANNRSVRPSW
jgi:hypothetical protein